MKRCCDFTYVQFFDIFCIFLGDFFHLFLLFSQFVNLFFFLELNHLCKS